MYVCVNKYMLNVKIKVTCAEQIFVNVSLLNPCALFY